MRNFTKLIFSLNFLYVILIAAECAAIIFLCLFIPSFMHVAAALGIAWLLTSSAVIFAVSRRGSPEINCALAVFITALPVAGAVIYMISRIGKKGCGKLNVTNCVPQSGEEAAALACCGTGGAYYDEAVYLKCGEEYFSLLFKQIERAKKRVVLEYFIVSRGKIFTRLLSALRIAKANGAEILFIIDGIGSAFKIGRKEINKLKAAGAQVKWFNRITPLLRTRLNNRDHRKIAVIDGKVAFTGGFNIADEYANVNSPLGYWKDTGVALFGDVAKVFEGMFFSVWNGDGEIQTEGYGEYRCIPYCDSPPSRTGFCENAYLAAISSAKYRVHIFTPYFCTGEKLTSALAFAAMRGVDVRVIIPHIPDKKYAFELSKSYAQALSQKGVKFYEYTPGFMHAKSMVCDGKLFIGSYNLDFRSMRLNYECGVILEDEPCENAERDFWECLRLSSLYCEGKVARPRRALRFILKLFAPLM